MYEHLSREKLELETLIRSMLQGLTEDVQKKNIDIKTQFPQKKVSFWGDRDRLVTALQNLCKYIIFYQNTNETLEVSLIEKEKEVNIEVSYSGVTIPEDVLSLIFTQQESLKDKEGEEIFKDLSLTKCITEMHHGNITFQTEKGGLTTFTFFFPRDLRKGTRIVIADDNPDIRHTLKDILTESHYQVDTVSNGYELIAYLRENKPNIVILDLMMPQKDGTEVFNTIKSIHPDIKVIIYTGFQRYENSPFAVTAEKFILKDESPLKLLKVIEELA